MNSMLIYKVWVNFLSLTKQLQYEKVMPCRVQVGVLFLNGMEHHVKRSQKKKKNLNPIKELTLNLFSIV